MASIVCPRFRPAMATVRPGVMKKNAFDPARAEAVKLTRYEVTLRPDDLATEVLEVVKAAKKLVDLVGADYIVSVGRGISKDVEKGVRLAEELAEALGGVVGGSRALPSTAAGSRRITRSDRPGKPSTQRSISPSVSPAPSSTRPV